MLQESEYGYNRDHDNLPQINIGLFTSEEHRYPVYMFTYNGSVNDKSELNYVLNSAKNIGLEKIKLILDGGFFDEERIKLLFDSGITFTVGVPLYLDLSKNIIDQHGYNVFSPENLTYTSDTYAKLVKNYNLFGVNGNILIGLSTDTAALLNENLNSTILRYKNEMDRIKKYKKVIKSKKYTDLFDIKEDDNSFTYIENIDKINKTRKYFGFFVIFTTDLDTSANDILQTYRDKDTDEKAFYEMKQYMDARRPRIHKQDTFDGKYFIVFLSLICRRWISKQLNSFKKMRHYTTKRCLLKLNDVRILQQDNDVQLLKAVTAEQREMLQICGVDIESLVKKASVILTSDLTQS